MSIERSKGKARPTLPRSSDLATVEPVPARTGGRDSNGRFAAANPWAAGAKWRSLIREGLGRDLEGEAGELGRRAHRLFRAFLADMPVDCASVRSLVAQRARAVALSDRYHHLGAKLGEGTPEGSAAFAEALKWDQRAERLAVTSLDVANKLVLVASKRPIDAHAGVLEAFGGRK